MQELLNWIETNVITVIGWVVALGVAIFSLGKKVAMQTEKEESFQSQLVVLNTQQLESTNRIEEIERILHSVVNDSGEHKRDLIEMTATMKELTVTLNTLNNTLSKQIGEFRIVKDIVLKKK